MRQKRRFIPKILLFVLIVSATNAIAQKARLQIDHTVSLSDPATQQFHISTTIKNIAQPSLDLSLPTWTPGWYTVENYYKNVLRFKITDKAGKWLNHTMSRKQTWNVDTRAVDEVRIEYDYQATVLALNQAKIADDFAFFTGIELFLQAEGHRNEPNTVHFSIPKGWKIVTALKETSDPMAFTAADYDTLVDAPVEMGNFDVTKFEVDGKPHYFIANPAGKFSKEKTDELTGMLAKIAKVDSSMFGGLPYDKYCYFYFFASPESNAGGALEHLNSYVAFAPPADIATPAGLIGTASHEFFHLWNVKRIRPAGMWPYDYSRENETPLLWVSEGFTNYYGNVATYRAGLKSKEDFLESVANAVGGVENNEARNYISPAEASVSTWVGYDSPVAFGISYYTQGQNLAALLDLSIRNDSDGASLDDVMRFLFNEYYRHDKGFTDEDILSIIKMPTKKDYHEFFRKYVNGTEVPDYDTILGYAGYKLDKLKGQEPFFGFSARFRNGGIAINAITPNSPSEAAGLKAGDVILKIDGETPLQAQLQSLAGKQVKLTIDRDGTPMDMQMKVGSREVTNYHLSEVSKPTAKQLKIREAWLKR